MSRLVVTISHVEFTSHSQVQYVVKVHQDIDEWEVRRTYSEFRKLRNDIHDVMKDERTHMFDDKFSRDFVQNLQEMAFPSKRLFGSKKDHVVKERAVELHRFLMKLLLLVHTYRKVQKAHYEQYVQAIPTHQQAVYAALQDRTQASATVFILLRDFLKPATTDVSSSHLRDFGIVSERYKKESTAGKESEALSNRLTRSSKISTRISSTTSDCKQNSNCKEHAKMKQHHYRVMQAEEQRSEQYRHDEQQVTRTLLMKHKNKAVNPANDNVNVTSQSDRGSGRNSSETGTIMEVSEHLRKDNESLRRQHSHKQHSTSVLPKERRKERHYSAQDGKNVNHQHRTTRAATSMLDSVGSSPRDDGSKSKKEYMITSLSVASSTSSSDGAQLLDLSSLSQYKTKKSLRRGSLSSDETHLLKTLGNKKQNSMTGSSEKNSFVRSKRKAKSVKNIAMSESYRMSRVSSALNAQTSINAQRELEKYLSEYNAIMIMRYVNRFINKAVMRGPGCYHVNAQRQLVIDGKRFFEELESTFTDLPQDFSELFHIGAHGGQDDWGLPLALSKYVQLKWESFHTLDSSSISQDYRHSNTTDLTSDSNDSDTDYDYVEVGGGGYMTTKHTFSNGEESMLQEMIANGTAGREQMLRLRRQVNEQGWNRRENPRSGSQRLVEEESSSNTDKEETRAEQREKRSAKWRDAKRRVSCSVEKYQQEQNARRKDRLSRVQSTGGFV